MYGYVDLNLSIGSSVVEGVGAGLRNNKPRGTRATAIVSSEHADRLGESCLRFALPLCPLISKQ